MAERITDKLVKGLTQPTSGNRVIYDEKVKGFGIRITAAGARAFVLNYRNAEGRERRLTIGAYGPNEWSVEAARFFRSKSGWPARPWRWCSAAATSTSTNLKRWFGKTILRAACCVLRKGAFSKRIRSTTRA